jgi:hypothetical protein
MGQTRPVSVAVAEYSRSKLDAGDYDKRYASFSFGD